MAVPLGGLCRCCQVARCQPEPRRPGGGAASLLRWPHRLAAGHVQSNRLSSLLVVPEGWSVQYRPEPVGVKETPEIPLATTVTVPVATMGMTGALGR